jgi:hypothetical protein
VVDVFEEVEEQLRSDRYRTLFRKGWPYALGAAVAALLIFAGVWGYRYYQDTQAAKASEAYAAAMAAGAADDSATAEKQFLELSESAPQAYRALALMQLAGLRITDGQTTEAVALLDRAADLAKEPLVADAARLKAAYALFDTATLEDLRTRLDPLTESGRPYAGMAREAVAMKQLASGQAAEARTAFSALSLFPEATDDLRARAQAAVALIDSGTYAMANKAAALAATLPPAPTPAPVAVGSAPPESASPPAGAPQ